MSERAVREWCPNCHHFFKDFGMNYCHIANWKDWPMNGGDPAALAWLKDNQEETSRIHPDADKCPRFVPFAELAQIVWVERRRGHIDEFQLTAIKRKP